MIDILQMAFVNSLSRYEVCYICIQILLNFVSKGPINQ